MQYGLTEISNRQLAIGNSLFVIRKSNTPGVRKDAK